jgi:hypothetical protein
MVPIVWLSGLMMQVFESVPPQRVFQSKKQWMQPCLSRDQKAPDMSHHAMAWQQPVLCAYNETLTERQGTC